MSHEPAENPFVGPRAFCAGEPLFGRHREIRELCDQLVPERLVLLYSPSGAGKTSLIQAGLLPEMREQGFYDLPIARVGLDSFGDLEPANRYVASLLLAWDEEFPQPLPIEELLSMEIADYLELRQEDLGSNVSLLLLLDQFEEIVTLDPTDLGAKRDFFRQLGQALDHPRRWALFSMREDYVPALDPYLRQLPTRLRTRFRLELLSPSGARAAIQEPARRAGCEISDTAADALVDDLRRLQIQTTDGRIEPALGPAVEPVQMQVVCFRWWRKEGATIDRLERWNPEAGGDVDSALRSFYVDNLREACALGGCTERSLRRWVGDHLISPGGLRTLTLDTEATQHVPPRARQHLVDNHLIRLERRQGVFWLELAHDRLVAPILASNEEWFEAHRSPLERHARWWHQEGRPDALVLRGDALREARAEAEAAEDDLGALARELLSRSEEIFRVTRHRRSLGFLVTLLCFLPFLLFQVWKKQEALTEARSRELATHALMKAGDDPGLAALLAAESSRLSDSLPPRGALLSVLEKYPRLLAELQEPARTTGERQPRPKSTQLAVSADGTTLRASSAATLRSWHLPEGRRATEQPLPNAIGPVWGIAFDPQGEHIALTTGGGKVDVLRLIDLSSVARFDLPPSFTITSLAFSPTTRHIAFGGSSPRPDDERTMAELVLVDWKQPTTLTRVPIADDTLVTTLSQSEITSLAFDLDGSRLATGFSNGLIHLRDAERGELIAPLPHRDGHTSAIKAMVFQPRDNQLVSASQDGTVRSWPIDTVGSSTIKLQHEGEVTAVAVDPEGRYLASGGADHSIRLFDTSKRHPVITLRGHRSQVVALAFGPRGRHLVSRSIDEQTLLWRTTEPYTILGSQNSIGSTLAFDSTGTLLSILGRSGTFEQWTVSDPTRIVNRPADSTPSQHIFLMPTAGYDRRSVSVSILRHPTTRFGNHEATLRQPDSSWQMRLVHPPGTELNRVAFAPQSNLFVTAANDGSIYRLDASTGRLLESKERGHAMSICALATSPLDPLVVSSDVGGQLRVWRLDPFEALPVHAEHDVVHTRDLCQLAIDPAGRVLAAADDAGTLSFWDLHPRRGARLRARIAGAMPNRKTIKSLAFDRLGELLAVGGYKELVLWDVAKHRQMGPALRAHESSVDDLAFSPTGPLLASSSDDRIVLWDLDVEHWRQRSCRLANRNLTPNEWRQYIGEDEPYRIQCADYPIPED